MRVAKRFLTIVLATSIIVPVCLVFSSLMGIYEDTVEAIFRHLRLPFSAEYVGKVWGQNVFFACLIAAFLSGFALINLYIEDARKQFHERSAR